MAACPVAFALLSWLAWPSNQSGWDDPVAVGFVAQSLALTFVSAIAIAVWWRSGLRSPLASVVAPAIVVTFTHILSLKSADGWLLLLTPVITLGAVCMTVVVVTDPGKRFRDTAATIGVLGLECALYAVLADLLGVAVSGLLALRMVFWRSPEHAQAGPVSVTPSDAVSAGSDRRPPGALEPAHVLASPAEPGAAPAGPKTPAPVRDVNGNGRAPAVLIGVMVIDALVFLAAVASLQQTQTSTSTCDVGLCESAGGVVLAGLAVLVAPILVGLWLVFYRPRD
jgi:hypothetical protein